MEAKFRKLTAESLADKRVAEIVDLVRDLDTVENVQELAGKLR